MSDLGKCDGALGCLCQWEGDVTPNVLTLYSTKLYAEAPNCNCPPLAIALREGSAN